MKALTTAAAVVLALVLASCGGSSSPTAPTPPPVVVAPPAARLAITEPLVYTSCVNGLCSFRSRVRNDGDACAANISGENWIISAQGVEVGRARWSLDPATVLRPGESVAYTGDGMPQIVLNHLDGRFDSRFFFDSRPC